MHIRRALWALSVPPSPRTVSNHSGTMVFKALAFGFVFATAVVAQVNTKPLSSCGVSPRNYQTADAANHRGKANCLTQSIAQAPCQPTDTNCICNTQADNIAYLVDGCITNTNSNCIDQLDPISTQIQLFCGMFPRRSQMRS